MSTSCTRSGGKADTNTIPHTMDVKAWLGISKMLKAERERVLHGRDNIWHYANSFQGLLSRLFIHFTSVKELDLYLCDGLAKRQIRAKEMDS
ncbi:acyl-CoA N-acyltransferase [Penicillium malachiteum]|nr:acyl-CoA N-acyltransferase [Penicillium malachiteum]